MATKNDVHNVLKVVGNCARLLVNDRQQSRGGEIKRGSRSSSSYLVSFPILVFSFITVFLVCGSCPHFSNLPYNFLLFSSSFSLSSFPFPSLLVSSVIILPIFFLSLFSSVSFFFYFLLVLDCLMIMLKTGGDDSRKISLLAGKSNQHNEVSSVHLKMRHTRKHFAKISP